MEQPARLVMVRAKPAMEPRIFAQLVLQVSCYKEACVIAEFLRAPLALLILVREIAVLLALVLIIFCIIMHA